MPTLTYQHSTPVTFFDVSNVAFNINTFVRTDEEIKVFLGLIHGKYIVTAILDRRPRILSLFLCWLLLVFSFTSSCSYVAPTNGVTTLLKVYLPFYGDTLRTDYVKT